MGKKITVKAPATVANMVCGFDILGFALEYPYDVFSVSLSEEPGIRIINKDDYQLPLDIEKNVSGAALMSLLETCSDVKGFVIESEKQIKPGSGIGSSAASAAGVVVAANHLLNKRFSNSDLIQFAMNGEKVASGVKHADNIAPCIFGGVTLIRSIFPLDIIPLHAPPLYVTVVHPQIEIRTEDARQILRQQVSLKSAIKQWGNVAGLVTGLIQEDYSLISRSLEDVIIEPVRSILIPGFVDIKEGCKQVGALGGGISGSGPSVFMLSKDSTTAQHCGNIMQNIYERLGVAYKVYQSSINRNGVQVFSDET
jgi:homoserine kinase